MIAILGGGISGLAAAWSLRKTTKRPIILFEKSSRLGGWIQSTREDGFFFEKGPRSLRPHGGEDTLRLIQELGLEREVVLGAKAAHTRFLFCDGSLHQLPRSALEALGKPWLWRAFPSLLTEWAKPKGSCADESIASFMNRRLGSFVTNQLVDPMTKGIYAGDIHRLSMKACFPKLFQYEKERGSITKALLFQKKRGEDTPFIKKVKKSSLYTLQGGLSTLVECIADRLDIEWQLETPVTAIRKQGGFFELATPRGNFHAEAVVSALPAETLGKLMEIHDEDLCRGLESIPMASLSVVHVGYRENVLQKNGFGYLIPTKEKEKILGVVFDSSAFPSQNQQAAETRLTVMMNEFDQDAVLEALERHLGIKKSPDVLKHQRQTNALPQYLVGHSEKVQAIQKKIYSFSDQFAVIGNCFEGVSVNDCLSCGFSAGLKFARKNSGSLQSN